MLDFVFVLGSEQLQGVVDNHTLSDSRVSSEEAWLVDLEEGVQAELMAEGGSGGNDQFEVRKSLVILERLDLGLPLLELLLFSQVIVEVEYGRAWSGWELASFEVIANDGIKDVLALGVERCTHAPSVRERKETLEILLLRLIITLEALFNSDQ